MKYLNLGQSWCPFSCVMNYMQQSYPIKNLHSEFDMQGIPSENAKKIEALHNKLQTQVNKINGPVDELAKAQAQKNTIEQELKQDQLKISRKWKVVTRMIAMTGTALTSANS